MRRHELEHVVRAASQIAGVGDVLVVGSQAILGGVDDVLLPDVATASMEVDVTFLDDADDRMSNLVDGAIGEMSPFHETYGYYAQGVSITTAVLPRGWRDRLVVVESAATAPGRGLCLDPHDCVLAKLVAGREKDLVFAEALLRAGLVRREILQERLTLMDDAHPVAVDRVASWLRSVDAG